MLKARPSPHGDGSLSWELGDYGFQFPTGGEIIMITTMKIAGAISGHLLNTTHFYTNPYSSPVKQALLLSPLYREATEPQKGI